WSGAPTAVSGPCVRACGSAPARSALRVALAIVVAAVGKGEDRAGRLHPDARAQLRFGRATVDDQLGAEGLEPVAREGPGKAALGDHGLEAGRIVLVVQRHDAQR